MASLDLRSYLITLAALLAIGFLLFMFPASFASTCWRIMHRRKKGKKYKVDKQPTGDKILSVLPLGSACMAHKAFYNEVGWIGIASIISAILMGIRLLFTLFPPLIYAAATNPVLATMSVYSLYSMWLGYLIMHIIYAYTYIDIARMFRFNAITYILLALLPYFTVFIMITKVPMQLKESEEEVFDNRFGEHDG